METKALSIKASVQPTGFQVAQHGCGSCSGRKKIRITSASPSSSDSEIEKNMYHSFPEGSILTGKGITNVNKQEQ